MARYKRLSTRPTLPPGRPRAACDKCGGPRPAGLRGALSGRRVPLCRACFEARPERTPGRARLRRPGIARVPAPPGLRGLLARVEAARAGGGA